MGHSVQLEQRDGLEYSDWSYGDTVGSEVWTEGQKLLYRTIVAAHVFSKMVQESGASSQAVWQRDHAEQDGCLSCTVCKSVAGSGNSIAANV